MHNAIADRVWLARDYARQAGMTPQFISVTRMSGIALTDVRDVATAMVDVGDILDDLIPVVFWCENGYSSGAPGGLVCQHGSVDFILYNSIRVPLLGGITAETLVRLLAGELGYSATTVIALTLFIGKAQPPEQLLSQRDPSFTARVITQRRTVWPSIFPLAYYRDDQNRRRDCCTPWAMGGGTPVKVGGQEPLVGCNVFLRRCQIEA